jgi:hypothetical protein
MNLQYKILFLSILSIGFPVGRLFEIFIWNDRITKTEVVAPDKRLGSGGRICFFVKIARELQKQLSLRLQAHLNLAVAAQIVSKQDTRSILVQLRKIRSFRKFIIRRSVSNVLYLDESEYALKPLL